MIKFNPLQMFSQALGMSLPGTVPASGYAMFQFPLTFVAAKASKPAATREDPRAVTERKREEPPKILYQPSRGFTLCDFTNQHLLICREADFAGKDCAAVVAALFSLAEKGLLEPQLDLRI